MDLNDADGDREAGVWTLPVMLGKPRALAAALAFACVGAAAAVRQLLMHSPLPAGLMSGALAPSVAWAALASLAVLVAAVVQLALLAWGIRRSGYDSRVVGSAVGACLKPIGLGMVLLAALA